MSNLEYCTNKEYINRLKKRYYEKSLDIALDIRKFEIDLYWKRATYFWAFAASIIALMAFCFRNPAFENDSFYHITLIILNSLLIIISYVWYLSSKGSKYWQENWEQHVSVLENEITGPVYGSFHLIHKKQFPESMLQGMPYSVSKLSMCLSIMMLSVWIILQIAIIFMTPVGYIFLLSLPFISIICFLINKYGRFSYFDDVVRGKNAGPKFTFVVPKKTNFF